MMFKCCECGHLFEDGEQAVWEERHGLDTPPYEQWSGCPLCRGGYEEVHQCQECDEWHTEDELYEGWCEKCLRETINYDTFFEYCESNKEKQYLDTFVIFDLLNGMEYPKNVNPDLHPIMIWIYKTYVQADCTGNMLHKCIRFIMNDDSIGREDYAKWLNKKGGEIMAGRSAIENRNKVLKDQIVIPISTEEKEAIRKLAIEQDKSMAAVVRDFLPNFLKEGKK